MLADHVADNRLAHGDDARRDEGLERGRDRADDGARGKTGDDDPQEADASHGVADGPAQGLEQAVGNEVGGKDHGGGARRDREGLRDGGQRR